MAWDLLPASSESANHLTLKPDAEILYHPGDELTAAQLDPLKAERPLSDSADLEIRYRTGG